MTMNNSRILTAAALMLAALACSRAEKSADTTQATTDTAGSSGPQGEAVPTAKISWNDEKSYDLTGDGRPERLTVKAFGPAYDSLTVLLEIIDPDGKTLYRDRWGSERYFAYDYRAGKADSTVERIVLTHLKQILSDSAFRSGRALGYDSLPDTTTVRYDLAERRVREQHRLLDTSTLGTQYLNEIEKVTIPQAEILGAIANMRNLPRFTYFSGGELTYTLAWSSALGRMVRVFSCC